MGSSTFLLPLPLRLFRSFALPFAIEHKWGRWKLFTNRLIYKRTSYITFSRRKNLQFIPKKLKTLTEDVANKRQIVDDSQSIWINFPRQEPNDSCLILTHVRVGRNVVFGVSSMTLVKRVRYLAERSMVSISKVKYTRKGFLSNRTSADLHSKVIIIIITIYYANSNNHNWSRTVELFSFT